MIHGNAGRPPRNRIADPLREKTLKLSKEVYWDFNGMHFTEKPSEQKEIKLRLEMVRRSRREPGKKPKRWRRAPEHNNRRERKAQEGCIVLWDGSPHLWFGAARKTFKLHTFVCEHFGGIRDLSSAKACDAEI